MSDCTEASDTARAWAFFEEEREAIGRFISAMRRKYGLGQEGADALLSEGVSRLPDMIASYQGDHASAASLRTHVFANWKWLTHKLVRNSSAGKHGGIIHSNVDAARKRRGRPISREHGERLVDDGADAERRVMDADEVQYSLAELDSFNQALLHLRFTCELTYEDIGDYLEVSSGVARSHVLRAVEACRASLRDRASTVGASDECLALIAELKAELR